MKLSTEDKTLLEGLCKNHHVSYEKVMKLLNTVQEYEFKDRRIGVYDTLRDILRSSPNGGDTYEV